MIKVWNLRNRSGGKSSWRWRGVRFVSTLNWVENWSIFNFESLLSSASSCFLPCFPLSYDFFEATIQVLRVHWLGLRWDFWLQRSDMRHSLLAGSVLPYWIMKSGHLGGGGVDGIESDSF